VPGKLRLAAAAQQVDRSIPRILYRESSRTGQIITLEKAGSRFRTPGFRAFKYHLLHHNEGQGLGNGTRIFAEIS
ncbi:hypothetical protein, partial [Pseudomonas syringae]|uniref:hypothetical protein n=1 Tax=Pseudomonas syringae TaxID=317 RepID=UPI001F207D9D